MIIDVSVIQKRVYSNVNSIVCNNDDYVVHFSFDSDWDNLANKTMRVIFANKNYIDVPLTGSNAVLPIIYDSQDINIGVYSGDVHSSTSKTIYCQSSIQDNVESEYTTYDALLNERWGN